MRRPKATLSNHLVNGIGIKRAASDDHNEKEKKNSKRRCSDQENSSSYMQSSMFTLSNNTDANTASTPFSFDRSNGIELGTFDNFCFNNR